MGFLWFGLRNAGLWFSYSGTTILLTSLGSQSLSPESAAAAVDVAVAVFTTTVARLLLLGFALSRAERLWIETEDSGSVGCLTLWDMAHGQSLS